MANKWKGKRNSEHIKGFVVLAIASHKLGIARPTSGWARYSEVGFCVGPWFLTKNASFCTLKVDKYPYIVYL